MKNYLFPHVFRPIGWCVLVPSLVLGALIMFNAFSSSLSGTAETVVNDIAIIGTAVGALFILCSRERIEDEMTSSIRLSSLLQSIYIYIGLLILCTIFINDLAYLDFMVINLVLLPIIFVINFRWKMAQHNKLKGDEEQN